MSLAENKKIYLNYEIIEVLEAGIELLGIEVKSLRTHTTSLEGTYVTIRGGEAFLMNMQIPAYQVANTPKEYDPLRIKKLILNKKEIAKLASIEADKGLTIAPVKVYNNGRKIKVEIAVVRGKKKFDKRQDIKKRDTNREIQRTLKGE